MKGEETYERRTAKEKERTAGKDIDMIYCPAYHTAVAGNRNNRYISGARRVEKSQRLKRQHPRTQTERHQQGYKDQEIRHHRGQFRP